MDIMMKMAPYADFEETLGHLSLGHLSLGHWSLQPKPFKQKWAWPMGTGILTDRKVIRLGESMQRNSLTLIYEQKKKKCCRVHAAATT